MSLYEYRAEVVNVVDGDTLDLIVDLGFRVYVRHRVRLYGINTPETYGVKKESEEYAAGMKAKLRLEELLSLDSDGVILVNTHKDKQGKYGRWLVDLYVQLPNGEKLNVNQTLLEEGLADPYLG